MVGGYVVTARCVELLNFSENYLMFDPIPPVICIATGMYLIEHLASFRPNKSFQSIGNSSKLFLCMVSIVPHKIHTSVTSHWKHMGCKVAKR